MPCYNNSDECCALILSQYPILEQAVNELQPNISSELVQALFYLMALAYKPIYGQLKYGSVFCCAGLVQAIANAINLTLCQSDPNLANLIIVLQAILAQSGFTITCQVPLPPPLVVGFTGTANVPLIVPTGIFQIQFDLYGAQGGEVGGDTPTPTQRYGGRTLYNLPVIPGETLYLNVGGHPPDSISKTGGPGGFNGGGRGGNTLTAGISGGGGGGGASDVRRGGTALSNRVLIAGGGGGNGLFHVFGANPSNGGVGGGTVGGDGIIGSPGMNGLGGTQSAGGAAGTGDPNLPTSGSLGVGGNGGDNQGFGGGGGGGGGGYYGGGGGGVSGGGTGPGGGGSGFSPDGSGMTSGVQAGDGQIIVTYLCF